MSNSDHVNKNPLLTTNNNNNVKTADFGKKGLRVDVQDRTISGTEARLELRPVRKQTKMKRPTSFIMMQWMGLSLSIIWLLGAGAYINRTIGWDNISTFLPHELGGFLAGVFAPVALLWMVLAFVMRSADVKMYAEALRGELQAMIFPSATAEKRINNDIERLIAQSAEMSRATGMAAETLEVAKRTLQEQMGRFQETTAKASGNVTELNTSLNDRMKLLTEMTNKLSQETSTIEDKARESTQTWERAIAKAKDMAGVLDSSTGNLDKKTETFATVIDRLSTLQLDTARSVERAKTMIEEQREGLMADADRAAEYAAQVADAMTKGTDKLYGLTDDSVDKAKLVETRIQGQVASLERILIALDEKATSIEAKAETSVEKLTGAAEKSVAGAGDMTMAVEKAVEFMDAATTRARETADTAINSIGQKVQETASSFSEIQKQVRAMADLFDARREAMELSGKATGEQAVQIQKILDESLDKIAIRSAQLVTQVEQFRSQIEDPIDQIDGMTQKIGAKASSFAEILNNKIKELTDVTEVVHDRATDVGTNLDKRTKDIALLAGKIAGDTKKIGQELDKQEERLSGSVSKTVQSMATVNDSLASQSDKLAMVSDQSIERFKLIEKTLSERRRQLTDEASTAEKAISSVVSTFDTKARQINKQSTGVLNDVKTLNNALEDRADRFDTVSTKVVERIKKAQEAFNALQTGYKNVADESVHRLAEASGSFVNTLSTLRDGSQEATKIVDDVANKAAQSVARVESLTNALGAQSDEVQQTNTRMIETMEAGVSKLEEARDKFANSTDVIDTETGKVLGRFDEATQTLYTHVDKLDDVAQKTVGTARDVSRSIIQQTEAMVSQAQSAISDLDNAGARLAGKAQSAKDLIGSTALTTNTLTESLNTKIGDLSGLAESSSERIEKALNKLIAYTEKIDQSAETLAERLNTVSIAGSKVANDVDGTVGKLQQQADILIEASTKATEHIDKVRTEDGRVKRDNFLSSTKFVVESLHSLSLDFARMLQGELPEKTWKAYQRGDANAFTRHILALKDDASHDKIRDKFKDDYEFRTYVQRYLRQFEEVYDQAKGNDHGDLLSSVFMTSDVGKLYVYLCTVLKREYRGANENKQVA